MLLLLTCEFMGTVFTNALAFCFFLQLYVVFAGRGENILEII